MDSAQKRTAIVVETTQGTTPATPGFKVLRDMRVSGAPDRRQQRSPERAANRQTTNTFALPNSFPKAIEMPFAVDDGLDILFASVMQSAWATDVLKIASAIAPFTLEEKYENGATDPYRRLAGSFCDSLTMDWQIGQPGSLSFGLLAMSETTATTAISGATYASPNPGADPITPAGITVNSAFGLTSPKVMRFQLGIKNNAYNLYQFGSNDPYGQGLGSIDIEGALELYFGTLTEYSGFVAAYSGGIDLTIGTVANKKMQLVAGNCAVFNPDISDPGASGPHTVTLNINAKYYASDVSALKILRNVA